MEGADEGNEVGVSDIECSETGGLGKIASTILQYS